MCNPSITSALNDDTGIRSRQSGSAPYGAGGRIRPWVLGAALLLMAGCSSLPKDVQRPVSYALVRPDVTPLGQLSEHRRPGVQRPDLSGFALLSSPNMAYAGRLALTQQASRTLDIQYYAIHVDPTVSDLLRAVRAAAHRGVRVRILLDDFNSVGNDAGVMRMARVPGVQMRMFNPLPGDRRSGILRALGALDDFQRIQHRMHNKLYVADNAWGIVGGRNLGDAYFGTADGRNFVDMDVLATGPVVQRLSASFDRYWNNPLAYPVSSLVTSAELARLSETEEAAQRAHASPPAAAAGAPVMPPALDLRALPLTWAPAGLLVDSPLKLASERAGTPADAAVIEGLLSLLRTARHDVLIVSPYFVPGRQMLTLLGTLKKRGVHVRVLTNSLASTDALLAQIGYARHREQLLRLGVDLFEMRAREYARLRDTVLGFESAGTRASLHAKLVVVDGHILAIGSMNLDQRSKLQNTEIALVIRSPSLARQATRQVQAVIAAGTWKVTLTDQGALRWHEPPADPRQIVIRHDPDTSAWLRLLAKLLAPFTPDQML